MTDVPVKKLSRLNKVIDEIIFKLTKPKVIFQGRDRSVYVYKNHVVKIPVMDSWFEFVRGLYSNLKELDNVKNYKGKFPESMPELLGSWFFGLIVVYRKYEEVIDEKDHRRRFWHHFERYRSFDDHQHSYLWDEDIKVENFGWNKYGQLVKLDLGTNY